MKKHASRLLAAVIAALLLAVLSAAAVDTSPENQQIVILHTNDVHCEIDQVVQDGVVTNIGYAGVAAYRAEMEKDYGANRVTLVDAGDAIQGGPVGTLSDGAYLVDIMNEAGYDFAVPGNHEFDYGMDVFLDLARNRTAYSYLSCNFVDAAGNAVLDACKIVDYGNVQVAYVGISTPESVSKSTPAYFQDGQGNYLYGFCQGEQGHALYNRVQQTVDKARADGADYVVAIGHLGIDPQSAPWTSDEVVANTTGIDILIDGHSHTAFTRTVNNRDGEPVCLAQNSSKLESIGKLVIDPVTDTITSELVSGWAQQDAQALAFVESINNEFAQVLQRVVAKSDVALTTLDPVTGARAVRRAETNMGDFCADAYRVMLGADVAFANGGGIRADIPAGEITYEQIIKVQPYGNELCMIEVTGQQLLDALELGAMSVPNEDGGFLQVSGIRYTVDTSIPSSVQLNDEKMFLGVSGARRVRDVTVGGVPLEADQTYTLASHNYMLKEGGDGYTMFEGCTMLKDSVMLDNRALIDYITEVLGGTVGEEYADPAGQGRIRMTQTAQPEPEPTPVPTPTPTPQPTPTPADPSDQPSRTAYVVVRGDSLWRIARTQLGAGTRWREIYECNRDTIRDPDRIYVGQTLWLPAA